MTSPTEQPQHNRWLHVPLPYLVAICVPLAIVAANPADIPPWASIQRTLLMLVGATAAIHIPLRLLRLKAPAAELTVCAIQLHLVAYGVVYQRILGESIRHRIFLPIWTTLIAVGVFSIWRMKESKTSKFASSAQIGLLVLFGLQLVQLLPMQFMNGDEATHDSDVSAETPEGLASSLKFKPPTDRLPDVYYVILDAYGRSDCLRDLYAFDNAEFLTELDSRGFWIGKESRANYHYTRRSLPSSLNMTHLADMDPARFATRELSHRMVNQSEVAKLFNRAGYHTVALADGFQPIDDAVFDRYVTESYATSELDTALLGSTWILPLLEAVRRTSPIDSARDRVLRRFRLLGGLADESSDPLFVFAHILAPHRPFVFDAEGDPVYPPESFWDGASYTDPTPETRDMYVGVTRSSSNSSTARCWH